MLSAEQLQLPPHRLVRTVVPRTTTPSGDQIKCGCQWFVTFSRRDSGEYVLTEKGCLEHSGHTCVDPMELAHRIGSLRNVPLRVEKAVELFVGSDMHGVETFRWCLSEEQRVDLNRAMFDDLMRKTRQQMGIKDGQSDSDGSTPWLWQLTEMTGG